MKLLGRINVLGIATKVVLCRPDEVTAEELSEADHAASVAEDCAIYLNVDRNTVPDRARENIVHECVHVWLETSGAQNYLRGVCGLRGEAWDEVEENLVRILSPAISSSLEDLHTLSKALPKAFK